MESQKEKESEDLDRRKNKRRRLTYYILGLFLLSAFAVADSLWTRNINWLNTAYPNDNVNISGNLTVFGIFNGSVDCSSITGGADTDFCIEGVNTTDDILNVVNQSFLKLDQSTAQTLTASPVFNQFSGSASRLVTTDVTKKLGDTAIGALTGTGAIIVPANTFIVSLSKQISHSTANGYIHLPASGAVNQILKNSGTAGTGAWGTVTENAGALAAVTSIGMSGDLTNTAGNILLASDKLIKWNNGAVNMSYVSTSPQLVIQTDMTKVTGEMGVGTDASNNHWLTIGQTSSTIQGGIYIGNYYTGGVAGGEKRYNEVLSSVASSAYAGNHEALGINSRQQIVGNDSGYSHVAMGGQFEGAISQVFSGTMTGNHLLIGGKFRPSLTQLGAQTNTGTLYGIGGLFPQPVRSVGAGGSKVYTDSITGYFDGDVGITDGYRLFFESSLSETNRNFTKGDTSINYNTSTDTMDFLVDGNLSVRISGGETSLWVRQNISTGGIFLRTELYDKSLGTALSNIKDTDYYKNPDGSVAHNKSICSAEFEEDDLTKPIFANVEREESNWIEVIAFDTKEWIPKETATDKDLVYNYYDEAKGRFYTKKNTKTGIIQYYEFKTYKVVKSEVVAYQKKIVMQSNLECEKNLIKQGVSEIASEMCAKEPLKWSWCT